MRTLPFTGLRLPAVDLISTARGMCNLCDVEHGILFFVPFASPLDAMRPASRAGTSPRPYDLSYLLKDANAQGIALLSVGTKVFGVTTQTPFVQRIVADMLRLPFPLLSDRRRMLTERIGLPLITTGRVPRVRTAVLEVRNGCVIRARYGDPA